MEGSIDRYVLGMASLKGHLAVEHYYMSTQLFSTARAHITLYRDIATKVRLVERVAYLLRVPQLVPTSAEHTVELPEVIVNRVNRL
eukprot:3110211-Prymnesium_polylepis.1